MVVRSTHPRSVAVRRAFEAEGAPAFVDGLDVTESVGDGLSLAHRGAEWRLGRGAWASRDGSAHPLTLSRDGVTVATLDAEERLRPDAADEVRALSGEGYEVWMLSGDEPARVAEAAASLAIPAERAVGGARPEAKAAWVDAHDARDTLMIGDGINDALAVERAFCSATPAVDRPFMPTRADAWFTTAGLAPVRRALRVAAAVAAVNRRNLIVATAYNAVTVALALSGRMSPLLCAALMPLTSLSLIAATAWSLGPRRPLWRS
ncbi:MAG: HAD family hydrolase [Polyangiales bacterium]